ncbi:YeeE/YedE family protein [Oceanicola sp. 22II-s10i]|nr:YeeE/YedE family protein [Oceanicola sp. 22II-s10i]
MSDANAVALIGLAGGIVLGLAARIGRFCTLGAIEDWLYSSDDRRMRMWALAIGAAIIGAHGAAALGLLDFGQTAYLDQVWNPLGSIIGGLMFGYGMALSGNCGYGALARLGGGDLRSFFIVLVMGISAYVVMSGPLAQTRVWLFPVETGAERPQGFSQLAALHLGIPPLLTGAVIGAALIALGLSSRRMLASPSHIVWGLVVGLAVVSGWVGTQWVAANGFDAEPVQTHTFAAPIGDTIIYMMTASGTALSFSAGSVFGVLIGAVLGSYSKGHFRWEACEDPRELGRQILGAAIMGPGAILAVGCSVGQGISAFSLLAFSAPVTFAAILAGAAIGLRQLITGFAPAE